MSCEDNRENCHGTNCHGHESSATVCLHRNLDENAPSPVPSLSTLDASCKPSSNIPLVWCFQSQLLRPQSAQPTTSEQICGKSCDAHKNSSPHPHETDGDASSPRSENSTTCASSTLCSLISDLEDDSIITEVSSVSMHPSDWSLSSQLTAKSDQSNQAPEKFKASILESTMNLMKYRLNYPLLLAKSRHLTSTQTLLHCAQSLGSFAEEVLRKRADREPPNAVARPSALDAALWHIKHQWKCRYYTLLDAVDLLYKDYQLLHHVSADQNQRSHHVAFPQRLLSGYSVDSLAVENDKSIQIGVLAGADPVTHLANRIAEHTAACPQVHAWPHRFNASVCFILDVIAQCRLLRVQLDKMTEFRDRAFRLTTQAREQRDRLRRYMVEQRTGIAEVAKSLTEVRERITHMQRGPPVEIRHIQSLSQEEQNVVRTQEKIANQRSQLSVLETILREEEAKRRYMHNRLQEITGNIRVLCRLRPHSPSRRHPIDYLKVTSDDKLLLCPNEIPEILLG
ncbi:Carboxy-terminal kinesin 2, partial [Taenia solium]